MVEHPNRSGTARASGRIVVLLVDDQAFVATAIRQLLSAESDIDFYYCQAPLAAASVANEIQPAIILQDLVMPDIDGLTMLDLFRANPSTFATPVVVLSATDDPDRRVQALARGAANYLVKPPSKDALVACIRRLAGVAEAAVGRSTSPAPRSGPAEAPRSEDTLDRSVLASFHLGDPESADRFVSHLVGQFLRDAAMHIRELRSAADCGDPDRLQANAHTLRGAASTIGAFKLAGLCRQMERHAARTRNPVVLSALTNAIDREFTRVRAALGSDTTGNEL